MAWYREAPLNSFGYILLSVVFANQISIMKRSFLFPLLLMTALVTGSASAFAQKNNSDPWAKSQLMEPAQLASIMNDPQKKQPMVICVGPGALIKGSVDAGPARDQQHLDQLRKLVSGLPKDAEIVIYCGCCPFDRCPNIRPAFALLNEMRFTRHRLLDLSHNLKTDWIAKGYPTVK